MAHTDNLPIRAPDIAQTLMPAHRDIRDIVGLYRSKLDRYEGNRVEINGVIANRHRSQIESRRNHLKQYLDLNDNDRNRIRTAVLYLLWMYSVKQKTSMAEADANATAFTEILIGTPAYFVQKAVLDFLGGHVPDHDPGYQPTPGEIRKHAAKLSEDFGEELFRLEEILNAPVRLPISKEDEGKVIEAKKAWLDRTDPVAAQFAERQRQVDADTLARHRKSMAETNKRLFDRECEANGVPTTSVASPSLLNQVRQTKEAYIKQVRDSHQWDGPMICLDMIGNVPSCSRCGDDASTDRICRGNQQGS